MTARNFQVTVPSIRARLQSLIATNRHILRHSDLPSYAEWMKSSLYAPDPIVREVLRSAAELARSTAAWPDIEELTAWRLAELLERGEDARFELVAFLREHSSLDPQSLIIVRGDGRFENPLCPSDP